MTINVILRMLFAMANTLFKAETTSLFIFVVLFSVIFMVIGFIIYGVKLDDLHWSYALSVIGCIFTFVAGILSFLQLRSAGVRV